MRTLKKYPNRRLYDTSQSCFIALEDVKQLVLAGEPFEVHDSKTGEIITRTVLLQIIAEHEGDSAGSLLTDEVLRQLIRFYGDSLQGLLREYLERSMTMFLEQQNAFHDQLRSMVSGHPLNVMTPVTEPRIAMREPLSGGVVAHAAATGRSKK